MQQNTTDKQRTLGLIEAFRQDIEHQHTVLSTNEYVLANALTHGNTSDVESDEASKLREKMAFLAMDLLLSAAEQSQLTQTVVTESLERLLQDELQHWIKGVFLDLTELMDILKETPTLNTIQIKLYISVICRLIKDRALPFQLILPDYSVEKHIISKKVERRTTRKITGEHQIPQTLRKMQSAKLTQEPPFMLYAGITSIITATCVAFWYFLNV